MSQRARTALIAAVILIAVGGSAALIAALSMPPRCTPQNAQAAHAALRSTITEFAELGSAANNVTYLDLDPNIESMAALRESVASMRLPGCATAARDAQLALMDASLEAVRLRASQADRDEIGAAQLEAESLLLPWADALSELEALGTSTGSGG